MKQECRNCKWWSIKSDELGHCLHPIFYNEVRISASQCDFGKATSTEQMSIVNEVNNYGRVMLKGTFGCNLFTAGEE